MSFTIVCHSENYISKGPNNSIITFQTKFDLFEEGKKYNLDFAFTSEDAGALTADDSVLITIDNFVSTSYYTTTINGFQSATTLIGIASPVSVGNSHFLQAPMSSNPPVFIKNKPSSNQFTVKLYGFNGGYYAMGTTKYVLQLRFTPQEE